MLWAVGTCFCRVNRILIVAKITLHVIRMFRKMYMRLVQNMHVNRLVCACSILICFKGKGYILGEAILPF